MCAPYAFKQTSCTSHYRTRGIRTPTPTPHPLKHPPPPHTQELHHVLTVWLCPCPCASYWRPVNTSLGTLLRSDCLSSAGVQGTTSIHSCSPVKGDRASTLIDSCVHGQTDVLKCSQCEFTQFCAFTTGPRKNLTTKLLPRF